MNDYVCEHYGRKINKTSNCTKETRHDKSSRKLFKHFIDYVLTLKDDKYKLLQKVVPGVLGKGLGSVSCRVFRFHYFIQGCYSQ